MIFPPYCKLQVRWIPINDRLRNNILVLAAAMHLRAACHDGPQFATAHEATGNQVNRQLPSDPTVRDTYMSCNGHDLGTNRCCNEMWQDWCTYCGATCSTIFTVCANSSNARHLVHNAWR